MPPRRVARILWVIEYRDADVLSVNWSVIVAPIGPLSPGFSIAHTCAVDDVALSNRTFEPHGFSKPQGHGAFLRISKYYVGLWSVQRDLEIKYPPIRIGRFVNA